MTYKIYAVDQIRIHKENHGCNESGFVLAKGTEHAQYHETTQVIRTEFTNFDEANKNFEDQKRIYLEDDRQAEAVVLYELTVSDTDDIMSNRQISIAYCPITKNELLSVGNNLEAVSMDNTFYYVTCFDDEENTIYLGYVDDGYLHEETFDIDELCGRTDVVLYEAKPVRVR